MSSCRVGVHHARDNHKGDYWFAINSFGEAPLCKSFQRASKGSCLELKAMIPNGAGRGGQSGAGSLLCMQEVPDLILGIS